MQRANVAEPSFRRRRNLLLAPYKQIPRKLVRNMPSNVGAMSWPMSKSRSLVPRDDVSRRRFLAPRVAPARWNARKKPPVKRLGLSERWRSEKQMPRKLGMTDRERRFLPPGVAPARWNARNDPFATFIHLSRPRRKKLRVLALPCGPLRFAIGFGPHDTLCNARVVFVVEGDRRQPFPRIERPEQTVDGHRRAVDRLRHHRPQSMERRTMLFTHLGEAATTCVEGESVLIAVHRLAGSQSLQLRRREAVRTDELDGDVAQARAAVHDIRRFFADPIDHLAEA